MWDDLASSVWLAIINWSLCHLSGTSLTSLPLFLSRPARWGFALGSYRLNSQFHLSRRRSCGGHISVNPEVSLLLKKHRCEWLSCSLIGQSFQKTSGRRRAHSEAASQVWILHRLSGCGCCCMQDPALNNYSKIFASSLYPLAIDGSSPCKTGRHWVWCCSSGPYLSLAQNSDEWLSLDVFRQFKFAGQWWSWN